MSNAHQILQRVFGYAAFRGRQQEIIEHLCRGGDALVLMPTGGGKSLCYQIPALLRPGVAVVVSPLIALMQNQVDALVQLGIRAAYLNSTLDRRHAQAVEQQAAEGALDLLYVAPERLVTERFLALLDRMAAHHGLALFAIDEAHCVSQWGHDFRPEYLQLSTLHQRHPSVPRIALTATADAATRQEMTQRLGLEEAQLFVSSFDRPNLRYTVVEKSGSRRQLLGFLADRRGESGIIYCISRKKVESTARWLQTEGYRALPYHAGLEAAVRTEHQRRFLGEEGLIMTATIAFGMGIDKPDVRFVAHLDLPKSLEAYYQETGRAGRDGDAAEAWLSYGLQDLVLQRARIEQSTAPEEQRRLEHQKLDALLAYCESAHCRRVVLLRYFGEAAEPCGNCDVCLNPPQLWDGTVAAQKALSAIYRTGQRFGAAHIVDLLRGKSTEKIRRFGHDRLPTFGVGDELDDAGWREVLRQLVSCGLARADLTEHGALKLNAEARLVLKGGQRVQLRRSTRPVAQARTSQALAELPQEEALLFERLRRWRMETARAQGVPAYVILYDRTLRELARQRPATLRTLALIPGFGQAKLERYGAAVLAVITQEQST